MTEQAKPATDEQIAEWRSHPRHAINTFNFCQQLVARIDAEVAARKAAEARVDIDCEECCALTDTQLQELLDESRARRERIAELEAAGDRLLEVIGPARTEFAAEALEAWRKARGEQP
jgi:hypothetical protein